MRPVVLYYNVKKLSTYTVTNQENINGGKA